MMRKKVILVDEFDRMVGMEEKMKAHEKGLLHRAFSVFVVNEQDELLLQQRAGNKYHSPGLWTNTCCSHPAPGEDLRQSAEKRLREEMGFSCALTWLFKFTYKISFDNKLTEHEVDHVFLGRYHAQPVPNPSEVAEWRWESFDTLKRDMIENPQQYTFWFRHVFERFYDRYITL
jgi:isopentenyl-diphosphate delta-isomerase